MTESEWHECATPGEMIDHLNEWVHSLKRGRVAARRANARKQRLFCCAGCRLLWDSMTEAGRAVVVVAERYADEEATETERAEAQESAERFTEGESAANSAAYWAVWSDERGNHGSGSLYFYRDAGEALASRAGNRRGRALLKAQQTALAQLCDLLHDIFGNPFRPVSIDPAWLTSDVLALAGGIYAERAFDRMPILADALQDAGCENDDVLAHCRDTSLTHVRGCWVVDLVLGKK